MIRRITFTVLAVLAASSAMAQTKVGVVDFEAVIRQSTKAGAAFAAVESFRQEKQAVLTAMAEEFQSKQQTAQEQANSISDDRARQLASELQSLQTDIKRAKEDAELEGQRLTTEALNRIDGKLGPLVREIAIEKGLQLVLQNRPDLGVVFVDATIDLTPEVIQRFDAME